jgi:glycosyltransferase involved in cell wall biosynthesis
MKFLFVGTNPENTGAATHFVALAQAMAEAGHEVSAVVHPGGMIWEQLANSPVQRHAGSFRNAFDPRGWRTVLAVARACQPDWLVGNFGKEYWPLLGIGALLRVPVALFRHRTPAMSWISGYLLPRLARRFFAVSQNARQAYLARGIPAQLVHVLYNPVDMATCRPDPARRRQLLGTLGLDEDAIVLGYVGRLQVGKGIFTLLHAANAAMARQPRLHCLWIGEGPDGHRLRREAAASTQAQRHHFLGWVNDVAPWYSALSMLAFPSIATETFGRVSVEAQAAGVPVLASRIGGVPETLDAGVTGRLLPPGDEAAWCQAIVELCDPVVRRPMALAARDFVQMHFSTAVIASAFLGELLDSV